MLTAVWAVIGDNADSQAAEQLLFSRFAGSAQRQPPKGGGGDNAKETEQHEEKDKPLSLSEAMRAFDPDEVKLTF